MTDPSPADLNWEQSTCPDCGLIWSPRDLYNAIQEGSNIMELIEQWRTSPENRAIATTPPTWEGAQVVNDLGVPLAADTPDNEVTPTLLADIFVANGDRIERYIDTYGPGSYVAFLVNAGMAAAAEYELTADELEQAGVGTTTKE